MSNLSGLLSKQMQLKLFSDGGLGVDPQPFGNFCGFSAKTVMARFSGISPFERTEFLKFGSHFKE